MAPDGKGFFTVIDVHRGAATDVDLSGKAAVLWRQPGKAVIWGVPSPDGRHLAMVLYTIDANVYMVEDF